MYAVPSASQTVLPSARSMTRGTSSFQPCCWVNGCQRTDWSAAARSAAVRVLIARDARRPGGRRADSLHMGESG